MGFNSGFKGLKLAKVKVSLAPHDDVLGVEVYLYSFLNLTLDVGEL
jgi:hypothetical protein